MRSKYFVDSVALNTAGRGAGLSTLKKSCDLSYVTEQLDLLARAFRGMIGKEARSVPLSTEVASELTSPPVSIEVDHNNFDQRVFENDLKQWGGRRINFHGLRHTPATVMFDLRFDIRTVQMIVGHKNIETTLRSVHASGQNLQDAASAYVLTPIPTTKTSVASLPETQNFH